MTLTDNDDCTPLTEEELADIRDEIRFMTRDLDDQAWAEVEELEREIFAELDEEYLLVLRDLDDAAGSVLKTDTGIIISCVSADEDEVWLSGRPILFSPDWTEAFVFADIESAAEFLQYHPEIFDELEWAQINFQSIYMPMFVTGDDQDGVSDQAAGTKVHTGTGNDGTADVPGEQPVHSGAGGSPGHA